MENSGSGIGGIIFLLVALAFVILMVVSMWKVFDKAGKPGWASIVPIYNTIVMLEIAGKPIWWIVLLFVPIVSLIISIILIYSFVRSFGGGIGSFLLFLFLPFIYLPMLAFGDAQYIGPQD